MARLRGFEDISSCRLHRLCLDLASSIVSGRPSPRERSGESAALQLFALTGTLSMLPCTALSDFEDLLSKASPESRLGCQFAVVRSLPNIDGAFPVLHLLLKW